MNSLACTQLRIMFSCLYGQEVNLFVRVRDDCAFAEVEGLGKVRLQKHERNSTLFGRAGCQIACLSKSEDDFWKPLRDEVDCLVLSNLAGYTEFYRALDLTKELEEIEAVTCRLTSRSTDPEGS